MRQRRAGRDRVPHFIDAEAGESNAEKRKAENQRLENDDLDAAPAVAPRQREQTPDQFAVRVFLRMGFGKIQGVRRRLLAGFLQKQNRRRVQACR